MASKKNRFLLLGSFFCLLTAPFPQALSAKEIAGKKLFENRCASCHGLDARGSVKMAKTLGVDPIQLDLTGKSAIEKTSEELKRLIVSGHGKMPKQASLSDPKQIQSLIKYIHSLQKAYVRKVDAR